MRSIRGIIISLHACEAIINDKYILSLHACEALTSVPYTHFKMQLTWLPHKQFCKASQGSSICIAVLISHLLIGPPHSGERPQARASAFVCAWIRTPEHCGKLFISYGWLPHRLWVEASHLRPNRTPGGRMLNKRLPDFGARNLRTRVPKGSALKPLLSWFNIIAQCSVRAIVLH